MSQLRVSPQLAVIPPLTGDSQESTADPELDSDAETNIGAADIADCGDIAALFVTRGLANPDLDDPEVAATCDGGDVIVTSNGIPDYTYIEIAQYDELVVCKWIC